LIISSKYTKKSTSIILPKQKQNKTKQNMVAFKLVPIFVGRAFRVVSAKDPYGR
jgi:hypothetical protein